MDQIHYLANTTIAIVFPIRPNDPTIIIKIDMNLEN